MRVLLVEDETGIRSALSRVMQGHGHRVHEASSKRDAITILDRHGFDVVVLDVNLPDAPGWELLEHLHRAHDLTTLPRVIVMSAVPPSTERLRVLKPFGVLQKPFPVDSLLRMVAAESSLPLEPDDA